MKAKNINVEPLALLAELVGTFILAVVAITIASPLYVGFAMVILVFAIGAVSGAHVNPAVTFGLWSVKKLDTIKLPFYWAAQLIGALLALLASQWYQGVGHSISFASFGNLDPKIFVAELLGTAVFVFVVIAATHRQLAEAAKALAVGLGLLTGLAVGGGLLGVAVQSPSLASSASKEAPRITKVDGITANPAIALAATEKADQQQPQLSALTGQADTKTKKTPSSRLTWETVLGTLIGGALGANLYMVTAGENPFAQKKTVKAKVTKVFKKGKKK